MTNDDRWFRRPSFYVLLVTILVFFTVEPLMNYVIEPVPEPEPSEEEAVSVRQTTDLSTLASLTREFYESEGRFPESVEELMRWDDPEIPAVRLEVWTERLRFRPAEEDQLLQVYAGDGTPVGTINPRGGYTLIRQQPVSGTTDSSTR